MTPSCKSPVPVTVSTDCNDSSGDGTARSRWSVGVKAARAATSAGSGATD
jgi:hypothetical protein